MTQQELINQAALTSRQTAEALHELAKMMQAETPVTVYDVYGKPYEELEPDPGRYFTGELRPRAYATEYSWLSVDRDHPDSCQHKLPRLIYANRADIDAAYRGKIPPIPATHKGREFRCPKEADTWLDTTNGVCSGTYNQPRIILRRVPEPEKPAVPTVEEAYYGQSRDQLGTPDGYSLGDLEKCESGLTYLSVNGNPFIANAVSIGKYRIRLHPIPKPERIILERVWEDGKPAERHVKFGEYYGDGSCLNKWAVDRESNGEYPIYRRVEGE